MSDITQSKFVQIDTLDTAFQQELDQLMALAKSSANHHDQVKEAACYRMILQYAPDHPEANFYLAKILFHTLQMEEALQHIETAIQALPGNPAYWDVYLSILSNVGQQTHIDEAIKLRSQYISEQLISEDAEHLDAFQEITANTGNDNVIERKIKSLSNKAAVERVNDAKKSNPSLNRMTILFQRGDFKTLEQYTKKIISKNKNNAIAWRFNGLALLELEDISGALSSLKNALSITSNDAIIHFNIAICYARLTQPTMAEHHYREAIRLNPAMLEAYNNLGNLLKSKDQLDEAESCFRLMIAQQSDFILGYVNLASVLISKQAYSEAKSVAIKAVQLNPIMAEAQNILGRAFCEFKEFDNAADHFLQAIELKPAYQDPYYNLGVVYYKTKQYSKAKQYFEKYSTFNPSMSDSQCQLGNVSWYLNEPIDITMAYFQRAMELDSNNNEANTALLFLLTESAANSAEHLFEEHRRFGERVERDLIAHWPLHTNEKTLDRCLKVGFVSGDFYDHAVATFILPILNYLKNNVSIDLYAYVNNSDEDGVTAAIKERFHFWTEIHALSDIKVVEKIREDGIDILFDLSGHTAKNRLTVFAHKPAPVQISWIGYPGTTGLSAMDYFLTDQYVLPSGKFDQLFSEKLVQLPATAPFSPSKFSPEVNVLPALSNGYVTFGSFNRLSKISDTVIGVWSELLLSVPLSKLFLGGMSPDGNFQSLIDMFSKHGVERDRLIFFGRCSIDIFLDQFRKVDICLDTFPYNGGTTTLHSLWMGVPTLTIAGSTVAARTGIGILSHVGLQQFATSNSDQFIQEGVYWSQNLPTLADLRSDVRRRMIASPIRHPEVIGESINKAIRIMWKRWCEGLLPISFEVD